MTYLLLSIVCSAAIMLVFKLLERYKVSIFPVIVINYLVCVLLGLPATTDWPPFDYMIHQPWMLIGVFVGILFISLFYIIGVSIQKNGITVTVVAQRMSVVIPVTAAYFIYGDTFSVQKIIGIVLALLAVVFTTYKENKKQNVPTNKWLLFFPLIIFAGSGIIDTTIKYVQEYLLVIISLEDFLTVLFGTAFIIGLVVLIVQMLRAKMSIGYKSIIWGIILGVPNYGTMWFIMKALDLPGIESSVVFPINHIGTISLSALAAVIVFKENLNRFNIAGLVLAAIAIALIFMA